MTLPVRAPKALAEAHARVYTGAVGNIICKEGVL
jgi:hypothetical protein